MPIQPKLKAVLRKVFPSQRGRKGNTNSTGHVRPAHQRREEAQALHQPQAGDQPNRQHSGSADVQCLRGTETHGAVENEGRKAQWERLPEVSLGLLQTWAHNCAKTADPPGCHSTGGEEMEASFQITCKEEALTPRKMRETSVVAESPMKKRKIESWCTYFQRANTGRASNTGRTSRGQIQDVHQLHWSFCSSD